MRTVPLVLLAFVLAPSARAANLPAAQARFWQHVERHCGRAFAGRVIEAPAGDTTFAGKRLVMHVRECGGDSMRIPFVVGDDRSRTWVLHRTSGGLRLKHDHRHADGHPDSITWYGGDTAAPGSATRQEFPADALTATLIPRASTNVWTIEIVPRRTFAYALRRIGTDRRFRIEFDLTRPIAPPPPPWGAP
jgi:hypothetical protein